MNQLPTCMPPNVTVTLCCVSHVCHVWCKPTTGKVLFLHDVFFFCYSDIIIQTYKFDYGMAITIYKEFLDSFKLSCTNI